MKPIETAESLEDYKFLTWKLVLTVSEAIQGDYEKAQISKESLAEQIGTIEEFLRGNTDPIENLECYSLLHLCRSLRRALMKMN